MRLFLLVMLLCSISGSPQHRVAHEPVAGFGNEAVSLSISLPDDPTYTEVSILTAFQPQIRLKAVASGIDEGETVTVEIFEIIEGEEVLIGSGTDVELIVSPYPENSALLMGIHTFIAKATPRQGSNVGPTAKSSEKEVEREYVIDNYPLN
jgi:hypothetical protein